MFKLLLHCDKEISVYGIYRPIRRVLSYPTHCGHGHCVFNDRVKRGPVSIEVDSNPVMMVYMYGSVMIRFLTQVRGHRWCRNR